jgi:hypothetical protein
MLLLLFLSSSATIASISAQPADVHVAQTGHDVAGCGDQSSPCASVQGALQFNDAIAITITLEPGV